MPRESHFERASLEMLLGCASGRRDFERVLCLSESTSPSRRGPPRGAGASAGVESLPLLKVVDVGLVPLRAESTSPSKGGPSRGAGASVGVESPPLLKVVDVRLVPLRAHESPPLLGVGIVGAVPSR
jgi:hypothetical protein